MVYRPHRNRYNRPLSYNHSTVYIMTPRPGYHYRRGYGYYRPLPKKSINLLYFLIPIVAILFLFLLFAYLSRDKPSDTSGECNLGEVLKYDNYYEEFVCVKDNCPVDQRLTWFEDNVNDIYEYRCE